MKFTLSTGRYDPPAHVPMVYVTETVQWEYKQIIVDLAQGEWLPEGQLNELGLEGWELTAVCPLEISAYFYFKRVKR